MLKVELKKESNSLDGRVKQLEEALQKQNSDMAALKTKVMALEKKTEVVK